MEHKTKRGRVAPSHQLVMHRKIDWGPTVALVDKYAHVLSPQTRRPKDFIPLNRRIPSTSALMKRKRMTPEEEEGCCCRDPKLLVHVVEGFHQYNLLSLLVRWSDQKVEHNVEIDSDLHFGNDHRHKICTEVDDKIRIGCSRFLLQSAFACWTCAARSLAKYGQGEKSSDALSHQQAMPTEEVNLLHLMDHFLKLWGSSEEMMHFPLLVQSL